MLSNNVDTTKYKDLDELGTFSLNNLIKVLREIHKDAETKRKHLKQTLEQVNHF